MASHLDSDSRPRRFDFCLQCERASAIPRWCNGSTTVSGTVSLDSNSGWGARLQPLESSSIGAHCPLAQLAVALDFGSGCSRFEPWADSKQSRRVATGESTDDVKGTLRMGLWYNGILLRAFTPWNQGSTPWGPTNKIKAFLVDREAFFVYARSMTEERALATVEEITELRPIEGADSIEVARVRGWDVVVKIGEFEVGDLVVFFEIDSFLPLDDPRFTFLAPRGARKNQEGVEGHVLKTAKLRGVYSQGLVLPYLDFQDEIASVGGGVATLGMDVTPGISGLEKWDPPIPAELAGSAKGAFPSIFRKTDEERAQNLSWLFDGSRTEPGNWVATEKIDGSSMTVFIRDGEDGVASRNWDIEDTSHNSMWKLARELDLHAKMRDWALKLDSSIPVALQGEIFGPGIQGNPLQVKDVQFRLFTIQLAGAEIPRDMWPDWALEISVPTLDLPFPVDVEEALRQADETKSKINPSRPIEGVVWRDTKRSTMPNGARASWKIVSNRYLLKHDR